MRRIKCYRCGKKGKATWHICSDGNKARAICIGCDIALNELVLKFMKFREWKSKIKKYKSVKDGE